MATLARTDKSNLAHITRINQRDEFIERHTPRRCMVVSAGLILAGLGIPGCMLIQIFPTTFLLGFGSLALLATGSVLALIFCGEI